MTKYEKIGKTSNEAVLKATGKEWDEWIKIIDKDGGEKMTHKEVAQMIYDKYLKTRDSGGNMGWWAQMVTVGYEYAKGKRVVGETLNTGFEIGVQKVLPITQEKLWKFINSPKGKSIWGNDAKTSLRTKKEGERLRMSYTPSSWKNESVLQINLSCNRNTPEKTNLGFHQEKMLNEKQRNQMRKHWQEIIGKIEKEI